VDLWAGLALSFFILEPADIKAPGGNRRKDLLIIVAVNNLKPI
jgi:hypothetical protein